MSPPRSITIRDRHRAVIKRRRDPCGICGADIDYALPYLHPKSFVVDHVIPLNRDGLDVLANKQAACRDCNRAKGDRLPGETGPRRRGPEPLMTSRSWR